MSVAGVTGVPISCKVHSAHQNWGIISNPLFIGIDTAYPRFMEFCRDTAMPCPYGDLSIRDVLHQRGICLLYKRRTRQCRVPTINHGRETALPCPLYHSGCAGIDIKGQSNNTLKIKIDIRQTALGCQHPNRIQTKRY